MLPAPVSIRILACPVPVIRTCPVPLRPLASRRVPDYFRRRIVGGRGPNVSDDEPVVSPDQLKPTVGRRAARIGAVVTIVILLLMTIGNKQGHLQDVWLVGIAAIIAFALVIDLI